MKLGRVDYLQPQSTAEACRLLAAGNQIQAIAGGTELVLALKNRQKQPTTLVDLAGIPGLDQISYSAQQGLRVGALVTLRHLAAHPAVQSRYGALAQAALSVGSVQIQAMGTVGGNLCQDTCCEYFNRSARARRSLEPCHKLGGSVCHVVAGSKQCWATYAGDLASVLLASGAKVKVANCDGEHVMPLQELFSGDGSRPLTLRPGQIVIEIQVPPPPPGSAAKYCKLRQRGTLDYPLVGVAVQLTVELRTTVCRQITVALTAVARAPVVVNGAGELQGKSISERGLQQLAESARQRAHPLKNLNDVAPSYRRQMVGVLVESAVKQALQAAAGSRGE